MAAIACWLPEPDLVRHLTLGDIMSIRKLYDRLGNLASHTIGSQREALASQNGRLFLNGHDMLLERVQEEDRLGSVTVCTGITLHDLRALDSAAGGLVDTESSAVRCGIASRGIRPHDWSPQRDRSKPHRRYDIVNPWGTEQPQWRIDDCGELLFVADVGKAWNPMARTAPNASFEELVPYALAAMAGDVILAGRTAQALQRTAAFFRQLGSIEADTLASRGAFSPSGRWSGTWPDLRLSAEVRGVLGKDQQTCHVVELSLLSADGAGGFDPTPLENDFYVLPLDRVWRALGRDGLGYANDENLECAGQDLWQMTTFWYQLPGEHEVISELYQRKLVAAALTCLVQDSRSFCGICLDLAEAYGRIAGTFPDDMEAVHFTLERHV